MGREEQFAMHRHSFRLFRQLLVTLCALLAMGSVFAGPARSAPLGQKLQQALGRPFPPEGLAVGVTLRQNDLPSAGPIRRALVAARQNRVLGTLPAGSFRLKRRYVSLSGLALWAHRPAIDALMGHSEVVSVYVDGTVHATLVEGRSLIGANVTRAQGFTGAGVRVAVLDTGIDTDHPSLADDLVAQQCFCDTHPSPNKSCCPPNFNAAQTSSAEDDEGHGTSVSGIITSTGVTLGVAPDAEIVAVKVLDSSGSGTFTDIAAALDWVIVNHASLGIRAVGGEL